MRHAIETAPRDGTVVILEHEPTGTSDVAYWSDQAAQWVAEIGTPTDIKPTHWRSMPRENYLPLAFDQAGEPARPRRWSLGAGVLAESAMTAGTSRPAQTVDAAAAAPPAAADARDNPETTKLISAGPYPAWSGKYRRGADSVPSKPAAHWPASPSRRPTTPPFSRHGERTERAAMRRRRGSLMRRPAPAEFWMRRIDWTNWISERLTSDILHPWPRSPTVATKPKRILQGVFP
jgi:hypothetical protein